MPVKKRIASAQKNAEVALHHIQLDLEKVLTGNKEDKRKHIESITISAIADIETYINQVANSELPAIKKFLSDLENQSIANGTDGFLHTDTLRKAYGDFKKEYDKGSKQQFSHQGSGILTNRLFVMYIELNRIAGSNIWKNKFSSAGNSTVTDIPQDSNAAMSTRLVTQQETQALAENIRQLWTTSKAVSEMKIEGFNGDVTDLEKALDEYFTSTDQEQHLIKKENEVNSLTGKIAQSIKIEEQGNRSKADYLIGTSKNQFFENQKQNDLQAVLNKYSKQFGDIKGSKAITGEVVAQLIDGALGKKLKKYKGNTTKTLKKGQKNPSKASKKLKNAIAGKGRMKLPALSAKIMTESGGSEEEQLSLLKLRTLIDKRLPAEVRRNMGRPALINRTGRFSNSVELLNLRKTPKGISGEYTYQLNPYQTFENTGQRRWPLGYNPKPLITKSIRNLALQYTNTQFTQFRRR